MSSTNLIPNALTPNWKEEMEQIRVRKEGIFRKTGAGITKHPTVILSIGGAGGKTLNQLKRKNQMAYGDSDHVWYLAIDTDEDELANFSAAKDGGYLKDNEMHKVLDPAAKKILIPPTPCPDFIKNWKKEGTLEVELDSKGAKQTRMIGRIMLAAGSAYSALERRLFTILQAAQNKSAEMGNATVDVIVLAGISGGTGSGMIVDICYMLRNLLEAPTKLAFYNYKLSAYLYMPDAQYQVQGIMGNPAAIMNLQKNGYAALKEINYFLNLEQNKGEYKLDLGNNQPITSRKNIFDSCTLISGLSINGADAFDRTLDALTDNLREILGDITYLENGLQIQLADAFNSNAQAMLNAWFQIHPDHGHYPKSAAYNYQVLGFSSVYIPKDEIINYCVDKMYLAMVDEFDRLGNVKPENLTTLLGGTHLNNAKELYNYAVQQVDLSLEIEIPKKAEFKNGDDTMGDANSQARRELVKLNAKWENAITKQFDNIQTQLDNFFTSHGPFFVMRLLEITDKEKGGFDGLLSYLSKLSFELQAKSDLAKQGKREDGTDILPLINELKSSIGERILGRGGTKQEREEYRDLCGEMAIRKILDAEIYGRLAAMVDALRGKYLAQNNTMYRVYTEILKTVADMLEKDVDQTGIHTETRGVSGSEFTFQLLETGSEEMRRLERYLDGFISPDSIRTLCNQFIQNIRLNRATWENFNNSTMLKGEIRKIFAAYVQNTLLTDSIEKFLVVAYSPRQLKIDDIDRIWQQDQKTRMTILQGVANRIAQHLINRSVSMASFMPGYPETVFSSKKYIGLPVSTRNLTPLIRQSVLALDPSYTVADSNLEDRISCTTLHFGIPMYVLSGMKEIHDTYIDNLESPGLHMDEVTEKWQDIAEPYNLDYAVRCDANRITKYTEKEYKLLLSIKETADRGMKNGCIQETPDHYTLLDMRGKPGNMDLFLQQLKGAATGGALSNISNFTEFMKNNGYVLYEIPLIWSNTGLRNKNLDGSGNTVQIGDFYKMLHNSRYFSMKLEENVKKFDATYQLWQTAKQEGESILNAVKRFNLFVNALCTGTIFCNDNVWIYTLDDEERELVNLRGAGAFEKPYRLYHAFVGFCRLPGEIMDVLQAQIEEQVKKNSGISEDEMAKILEEITARRKELGKFGADKDFAEMQRLATLDYSVALERQYSGHPFEALKDFYKKLGRFLGA